MAKHKLGKEMFSLSFGLVNSSTRGCLGGVLGISLDKYLDQLSFPKVS